MNRARSLLRSIRERASTPWAASGETRGQEVARVPGRPVLGHLVEFLRRPLGFLVDTYLHYGPVFRFDLPTSHSVFVGGESAREFLIAHSRPDGAARCPLSRAGLFAPFAEEVGLPVFDAEGERHGMLRELIALPYSRHVTAQFVPEISRVVDEAVASWLPGQQVDLFQTGCQLALHAIMTVVTPIDLRDYTDDIVRAGNRVMYAQFRLLPEASLKTPDYVRARRRMQHVIDEAIARHAEGEFASREKVHLIDACLRARSSSGARMDKDVIRGVCFYALAGSEIYMGRLVCFMLYELLRNQVYLDHVLEEIDSTSAGDGLASAFRRMPFLRAAYHETLRCYPLIPGYSYVATADTEVAGHRVARGEQVVFAPYLGHFDHKHYVNPMAFDADRHSRARRQFARSELFAPFGIGHHACAAIGMVEMIVLSIVTEILRRVELRLDEPSQPMRLTLRPLIAPADPARARVGGERRSRCRFAADSHLAEIADFHRGQDSADRVEALPDKAPEQLAKGQRLFEEGAVADAFFVVVEGTLSVRRRVAPDGEEVIAKKEPGSCLGEVGLLTTLRRDTSAVAETSARVLRFTSEEFLGLLRQHDLTPDDLRSLYYARYIKSLLSDSLARFRDAIAPESMQWRQIAAGEYMFRQGEPSDAFYIIVEGGAEVLSESEGTSKLIANLAPGSFFGELGILNSQPRGASVRASSPLKALRIEREVFLSTLQDNPDALSDLALITCRRLLALVQTEDV